MAQTEKTGLLGSVQEAPHTPRAARPVRQNEQTGLLNDVSRDAAPAPRARPAWVLPALQGVIQAILLVPVTLSFSAIIFKHPFET